MGQYKKIIIGGIVLVIGWVNLLLATLDVIPKSFWLAFVAYALTIIGVVVGLLGVAMHVQTNRRTNDD